MKNILIIEDGSELTGALLALLNGEVVIDDPIMRLEIKCIDLPCEVRCNLGIDKSFTPPHKKARRGKFKRSGR